MVGELFLSSYFAIEEGTTFENKFFMLFIIFLKQTIVKMSVYATKASFCLLFLFLG